MQQGLNDILFCADSTNGRTLAVASAERVFSNLGYVIFDGNNSKENEQSLEVCWHSPYFW
jgi:hypothetical protein